MHKLAYGCVCNTYVIISKYRRYRSERLKANGFCVFVCSDFGVGGWVSVNLIVAQILKSVGKNGRSLKYWGLGVPRNIGGIGI